MNKENWTHLSLDELKELSSALNIWYSASQELKASTERAETIRQLRDQLSLVYKQRLEDELDKELQNIQDIAEETLTDGG